jgi:predicted nucleic acid-binding protein
VIILDTNVISEVMRAEPDEYVARWLREQPSAMLYVTSVTQAEIWYGLERLPVGRRRARLEEQAEGLFAEDFAGRVLPFETEAARAYAKIVAARISKGRPMAQFDTQIAAITLVSRATLATRDTEGYWDCGIKLIDPWND